MNPFLVTSLAFFVCLAGCSKREAASTPTTEARESKPVLQTIAADPGTPAPPPPPPAGYVPPTDTAAAPEKESARKLAPSVYDDISPAQRAAADKDKLYRDWALAFRGGSDQQKAKARAAVSKLSGDERAAFEAFCKQYGVKIQ